MAASDSDRLLATGVPLVLADGREVRLRYGMRSLKMLEDHFGNLQTAQNALATDGKMIDPLMNLLACGLVHEKITAEDLLDLADPLELETYTAALVQAFDQAFPDRKAQAGKAEVALAQPHSNGDSSITSAPSSSDAVTASSGTS